MFRPTILVSFLLILLAFYFFLYLYVMDSHNKRNGDDEISPATLDVNTENDDYNNPSMAPRSTSERRDRRNNNSGREFAPLLEEQEGRLSISTTHNDFFELEDEEHGLLASPPAINKRGKYCPGFLFFWKSKRQTTQQTEKGRATRKICCLRRKTYFICTTIILLPIIAFIIFCAVYFSPASLPKDIPMTKVTLLQQNKTPPRVLTFNMFMRPPGIKNNENDFKNERLDYIVQNILPDYDIITIQEAFAYANRRIDKLLAAAFKQGFYYHVSSARHYPWDLGGDGGLLILSRYPIVKSDRIEFPRGVHSDW